jgi:hypothetical protein
MVTEEEEPPGPFQAVPRVSYTSAADAFEFEELMTLQSQSSHTWLEPVHR